MSDLISRSALLKSYDIAKMVEYDETGCGVTRIAIPVQAIKDAPAVDAVEVVRCKDCKHRGTCDCPMLQEIEFYDEDDGWDYRDIDNAVDDGFCHNGAKMDGGADNG